jgi:hypothetical protein
MKKPVTSEVNDAIDALRIPVGISIHVRKGHYAFNTDNYYGG